jgi:transglutaminase-like putative cysteine protease
MNLSRALQINTAALAVMGALFLGLAHESILLPLALVGAAVASVTLSGVFSWLRLNRIIANLIALAAVAWSLRNFLQIDPDGKLLAIADMLVYLQIVLLFQEKTERVYWQLVVLSVLQVVVAAALNLGPQFGLLLIAYMVLALSALVLLCWHHQYQALGAGAGLTGAMAEASSPGNCQTLLARPQVQSPDARSLEPARGMVVAVGRQVLLLTLATLAFTAVFFYAVPRLREGVWSGTNRRGAMTTTGFATEARLEEFGRIHLSNRLVMRVAFSTVVNRQRYLMITEPYFQGVTLGAYVRDERGSRWIESGLPERPRQATYGNLFERTSVTSSTLVRQDIVLEHGASSTLFGVMPARQAEEGIESIEGYRPRIASRRGTLKLIPGPGEEVLTGRELRYSLETTAIRNGRQLHGVPHYIVADSEINRAWLGNEREHYLEPNGPLASAAQQFPALALAAEEALAAEGLQEAGPLERALALERHFLASPRYRYSLNLNFPRDASLDPLEDFVANHGTGHCEYFGGALAMMLRTQGIPSRVVVGYKGGDFNSLGQYYQVRERHAHAWVEALIPGDQVPEWEVAGAARNVDIWYRLDPTPVSREGGAEASESLSVAGRVLEAFDYADLLWRDYVLSLNSVRQQATVYEPMSSKALVAVPSWFESRNFRRQWRRWTAMLGFPQEPQNRAGARRPTIDWPVGLLVVVVVAVVAIGIRAAVALIRWLQSQHMRSKPRGGTSVPPKFYVRLESLLARMGLHRAPGQTARELSSDAAARLLAAVSAKEVAELPADIVAAYYRVRFGGAALDKEELSGIEHALAHLTPAVNQARL